MPAITVSSVNTGTEEITVVAHGLLTGDRFRLRNVGGALPAATPSLAAVTDYFAIRTGADTLKISDTNAHALAGTNIVDLTGSGSGTTTVEYGLPYCIPTALAAPGTLMKSADFNGTWAALVAFYALLTGQAQAIWSTILIALNVTLTANQHFTVSGTGKFKHGTKTIPVIVQPNAATAPATGGVNMLGLASYYAVQGVPVGARLLGARVTVIDSVTGPTKLTLGFAFVDCSTPSSPSAGAAGTGSQSTGSGTSQNIATAAVTLTTTTGQNWYLLVNTATGAATCKVIAAEVDYDQP
jgi:hypothetical protein